MILVRNKTLLMGIWVWLLSHIVYAQSGLDTAVDEALLRFNNQMGNLTLYREVGRISDKDGAVIYVEVVNRETGEAYPGVVDWLYANHVGDEWVVTIPGDATYRSAYRQLSDSLTDQIDSTDRLYRTLAQPNLVEPEHLLDYELPFPTGAFGTITRSFNRHGIGKIDFDLTAREISAAKAGNIIYANDLNSLQTFQAGAWWYWNTVIIQHAEHEYSLYGHIAEGSIPAWVREACSGDLSKSNCNVPVRVGEVIALEGNTGNSTNPHLHVEFGQGFGVVPYLDVLDSDQDGNREEVIYAGYVYGEHDVGLNGYVPEEVGRWEYLTVLESEVNE